MGGEHLGDVKHVMRVIVTMWGHVRGTRVQWPGARVRADPTWQEPIADHFNHVLDVTGICYKVKKTVKEVSGAHHHSRTLQAAGVLSDKAAQIYESLQLAFAHILVFNNPHRKSY